MSFHNKVVIVTGGSSGIGACIAKSFSKERANVVIVGRNDEKLNNVAAECKKLGTEAFVVKADIVNNDEAKNCIKKTIEKFGQVDILINNAGIIKNASIFDENVMEVYDQIMNINTRATVHMTHLAAPHLIKTKGTIINISSVTSLMVPKNHGHMAYSVSKAALDHFTKCVASELSKYGVRVNTINPGPFKTDILDNAGYENTEEMWRMYAGVTALKKTGELEELADMTLYLCSEKAKSITGANILIDNGQLLK